MCCRFMQSDIDSRYIIRVAESILLCLLEMFVYRFIYLYVFVYVLVSV